MAIEVLRAIKSGNLNYPRKVHHDLESFTLVFHYALYMHIFKQYKLLNKQDEALYAEFRYVFGSLDLFNMISARTSQISILLPRLGQALITLRHIRLHQVHKEFIQLRRQQMPQQSIIDYENLSRLVEADGGNNVPLDSVIEVPASGADLLTYEKLLAVLDMFIGLYRKDT